MDVGSWLRNFGLGQYESSFREATGRPGILYCEHAFHGLTNGALSLNQDLRAARSILWLRRNRQTYWTSTSPSASASRGPGPACKPFRGWLVQQLQNPLVGRLRIDRLLARPQLVLQTFKAMVGIAMAPKADNPRSDPNFLG